MNKLSGWTRARPVRIAFLVEENDHSSLTLDGIFADCYGRWGGRFSLIVPCVDSKISSAYWPWLERVGPDVVYSYVELSEEDVLELHERLSPHQYIARRSTPDQRQDVFGFKPDYEPRPLSSLSIVFKLARYALKPEAGSPIKIIDSWFTEKPSQLLTDNFGTYHHSAGTGIFPSDASVAASLICVVSPEYKQGRQHGVPPDLLTVPTEVAIFEEYASRKATPLSVISAQFAARLEFHIPRWGNSLNIVLGDTYNDRLLFWNARLLTPAWLDGDVGSFRVTLDDLKDVKFLSAIGEILKHRNYYGGSGHSNITIRSVSASGADLDEAADLLRSTKPWGSVNVEPVASLDAIVPPLNAIRHAAEKAHTDQPFFEMPEWTQFNWVAPVAHPPTVSPEHLRDAPPQQRFVQGYWCVDFSLEYADLEIRSGSNVWSLPTRWRMARAFAHSHIGKTGPTGWSPRGWRSQGGLYSTYVSEVRKISSLKPPSALEALQWALSIDGDRAPDDETYPPSKVGRLAPSNEARYLAGVLGMAGGLSGAQRLLLHPFLLDVYASFGGTTNLPAEKGLPTANRLKKKLRLKPVFDLRDEQERGALATLIVKAQAELRKPIDYISYDALHERWDEYRAYYWKANPSLDVPDDSVDWEEYERQTLDDCLIELRRRKFLFQGHQWTCRQCHHRNWLDMSELSPSLACTICKEEEPAPVNLKWLFRPNNFIIESLRDHSVVSLLWVLTELQHRARQSFIVVGPTWFYFDRDRDKLDAEADLLVVVDGKALLCEVKASWSVLRRSDISDLVSLAKRLRADSAILAVMDTGSKLSEEIRVAREALKEAGIFFELITLDKHPLDERPYLGSA